MHLHQPLKYKTVILPKIELHRFSNVYSGLETHTGIALMIFDCVQVLIWYTMWIYTKAD